MPAAIPLIAAVGGAAAASAIGTSASVILVLGSTGMAEPCVAAPLGGMFDQREPEPLPPGATLCAIGRSVIAPTSVDAYRPDARPHRARPPRRPRHGRARQRPRSRADPARRASRARGRLALCRAHGRCLAGLTGEGDVAWYSESEGIAPGDLVLFRVAGDPMTRQKVYVGAVGECEATRQLFGNVPGPFLCWWQWNPHSLVIAPREDVTAHLCATHIWRRSTREAEQLFRFDTAPFTRPAETIMPVLDGATIDPVPLPAEFRAEYEAQLPTHATEEVN